MKKEQIQIIKDILDMLAAIFTIIVSWIAISGVIHAYETGFFHKLDKIVSHYHNEITHIEESDIEKIIP